MDVTGGSNLVRNIFFASVQVDTKTGELLSTSTNYSIGYYLRFISPEAIRVSIPISVSFIESTTFKDTDGSMFTVVMNKTDDTIIYSLVIGDS
ncbi:hypothetical protein HZY62_16205 [Maribacter polysiphoniae]|uniref:Glucosylceramidase n=1 Tax=Maribacter polysiphoniae TaxID=429344 RepID=A0A316DU48_9FLAO|nr:glycoside hydrolase family 30 beta sandwich domain-containing protein [Maribacter polysiphoniae]MBD1262146.1 hypothetical protein [Maribacter polysiphoniae]PWK21594.1 glucosylceramidase [Maribacter polysiphoniae]